jgi:hypothetical protein
MCLFGPLNPRKGVSTGKDWGCLKPQGDDVGYDIPKHKLEIRNPNIEIRNKFEFPKSK